MRRALIGGGMMFIAMRHDTLKLGAIIVMMVACTKHEADRKTIDPPLEPMSQQATRGEDRPNDPKHGYVGVLAPRESKDVVASFTSNVDQVMVKLGDSVQQGQPLAHLDERPLRQELEIATAALHGSQAEASKAYLESRASRAALQRERKALKENVASQADVTGAQFNAGKAGAGADSASAAVAEQRARIAKLQQRLTDTTLTAPLTGRVALLYVQEGAHVEEGVPVIRVISSDELFVKFAIPADQLGTMAPGDEIDVVIEQQGIKTPGVVRHVAPGLDPVAQMILADAELVAPPAKLQSGLVCRIVPKPGHAAKAP